MTGYKWAGKYRLDEAPEIVQKIFENPEYKLTAGDAEILVDFILNVSELLGSFPLDFEYQKERRMSIIHLEPGREPHVVLKGRNIFDKPIKARDGEGNIREVYPGERFKTHIPASDSDKYL